MAWISESDLEVWKMEKFAGLGYASASGAEISPEKPDPERRSFHEAILRKVFEKAVRRLNRAVAFTEVVDILEVCGFDRPDISVLSEEFLLEILHRRVPARRGSAARADRRRSARGARARCA